MENDMPQRFDLLIPTRARPLNLHRMLASIEDTADDPGRITVFFYVDDDDEVTQHHIPGLREHHPKLQLHFAVGPRIVLSKMYTGMAGDSRSTGDILWSGGDDIVFRTKGWDTLIAAEFE
ncbi:MAG: hypothetical protein IMZ71_05815, partial [Chloroflexi bacterium]|nr:hypothetical protein [Chloroflexota bacterium]